MNASIQEFELTITYWILSTSSIGFCLSIGMFGFLVYHFLTSRNANHRITFLLTANIYLALVFSSIMFIIHYARVLPAYLYIFRSLDDGIICQILGYFHWVPICAILYSNSLQATYHLCRIVFHRKAFCQSLRFYKLLILFQWIICFLLPIPCLLLGDYQYSIIDYNCQINITNIRSAIMMGIFTYEIPVNLVYYGYIRAWITLRQGNNSLIHRMIQIQRRNAQRDMIVVFRMCCLLNLLIAYFTPSLAFLFMYFAVGYVPWWATSCIWLGLNLSTISVIFILPFMSPHIYNLTKKNFCHHPHLNRA